MIKYKRFHKYEGSVKFKLMIIMTIIVNYLFKLLFIAINDVIEAVDVIFSKPLYRPFLLAK